jgi:hypothetical protein
MRRQNSPTSSVRYRRSRGTPFLPSVFEWNLRFDGTAKCEAYDRRGHSVPFNVPAATRKIIRRAVITFRPDSGVNKSAHSWSPWTLFCTVVRNICGSPEWNLLIVTLLAARILRWLLYVLGIFFTLLGMATSTGEYD